MRNTEKPYRQNLPDPLYWRWNRQRLCSPGGAGAVPHGKGQASVFSAVLDA